MLEEALLEIPSLKVKKKSDDFFEVRDEPVLDLDIPKEVFNLELKEADFFYYLKRKNSSFVELGTDRRVIFEEDDVREYISGMDLHTQRLTIFWADSTKDSFDLEHFTTYETDKGCIFWLRII